MGTSYYSTHRSEVLAKAKVRRDDNLELYRERGREASKRWRDANLELSRERVRVARRCWRDSHRDYYRVMRNAQQTIPLGDCCEVCGSVDGLMRFLPDFGHSKVVVTVCRGCRGWVRRSLAIV